MKKGLFTAAVIAAMMMTQPVMAQEVVEIRLPQSHWL